jgi:hypothetical protein
MNRPVGTNPADQIVLDRFDVANASFWLDQIAVWLAEADHAERFAADQWPGFDCSHNSSHNGNLSNNLSGTPLPVIIDRAAANLRAALRDGDGDGDEDGGP